MGDYQRILVSLDGSELAERALKPAVSLAAVTAVVTLIYTAHWGYESLLLTLLGTAFILALGAFTYAWLGEE